MRERIRGAAVRAGRDPEGIEICVVTKQADIPQIRDAVAAGARILGENRVQVAESKILQLRDLDVRWHLIGNLQRNKARRALELFHEVESVDSLRLARRLSELGGELGRVVPVLFEVLTSDEVTKSGFPEAHVVDAVAEARELPGIDVGGLMTMAPLTDDETRVRRSFATLRRLAEAAFPAGATLSMGMSDDFELAVEEGSTRVRVGSAIFS